MPHHIIFLLRHAAIGAGIAAVFVAGLMWFNVMNLWYLVSNSPDGPLAVGVLWVLCAITFGSVQMGVRIMLMAEDDD